MYFWKIKEYLHFGVLLTVQALALVSESTLRFALPLYLLNVSGSPSLYGVATAVAFVPSVLLMPAAGVVADRVDIRRILVIAGSVLVLCSACYLFLFRAYLLVMTILFLVALYAVHALYIPMFNMSRTLSIGKTGPGLDSFEPEPSPSSISTLLRRPRRVSPTLVFAV